MGSGRAGRLSIIFLLLITGHSRIWSANLFIISSPADISDLQPVVEVRGRVSDPAAKLAWDVPGTALGGEATLAPDGSFAFRVETEGLHLTQSVRIVARDSAGRSDEQVLLLVDPDPGPLLTLDEPAVSLTEGQVFVVSGRISDPLGGLPTGWLDSLIWSLPPTGRAGVIEVDQDGRFSADIDGAVPEHGTLWLRAADRFGHLTLRQVRIGGQKAAVETAAAAVSGSARIEISSPAGIGWYRTRLTVEGRLHGADASEEPLTWNVSGDRGQSGEILVDSDGTFRLELATGDLTGDRLLAFAVHTASGGTVEASVELRDGRRAPEVRIDSPANGGEYGSVLQLKGSVIDPYAGIAGLGGFESVSWQMAPLGVASGEEIRSGPVTVGTDGSFDVAIPTRGMAGQQLISVVAVGRSGNRGEAGVRVARGESDIPSFAAIAGDGAVTLRWDAQAGEARYGVIYARDREVGDGTGAFVVENVQSPYVIRGLTNGSRYVFRIRAAEAGRPDAWSTEQDAIPLAPGTLKPTAVGEYGGVRLSWASVPGVKSCEVWRSALREDGWALVASGLAGSSWFDEQAAAGLTWFYRIRPEITGAIASDPTPAAALEFADRALEPAGSLVLAGARAVAVSGAYAWVCCGAGGIRVIDLGDPDSPREVASLPLADARAIAVAGTVACVADGERGVVLLDVSDPRAPRVTGVRYLQDPRSVAMSSDVAYVACGTGGVRLVDISDPHSPERLGVVASDDARELCLYAGRLLVADAEAGLRVYDLASPASPRLVSELALPGARGVSARGARAVVLTAGGFSIVDIGDPAHPAVMTTIEQTVSCAVMADDGYAIVAGQVRRGSPGCCGADGQADRHRTGIQRGMHRTGRRLRVRSRRGLASAAADPRAGQSCRARRSPRSRQRQSDRRGRRSDVHRRTLIRAARLRGVRARFPTHHPASRYPRRPVRGGCRYGRFPRVYRGRCGGIADRRG